jgi:DNA-binding beta-propeller fold protein YncE
MTNLFIRSRTRPIGTLILPILIARRAILALALGCGASLALAHAAGAARMVYFADPAAGAIAQFAVGPAGTLTPLDPGSVTADRPLRLAMTPEGDNLYATADDGILQFDVAADGRLTPKSSAIRPAYGAPYAIAIHPGGASAYVTDLRRDTVRQYDIAGGGQLEPKDPAAVSAGEFPTGIAVRPDGRTAYALVKGGIAVFDVGAGGRLVRRPQRVDVPRASLMDLALTPDGRHLYASSLYGTVFQFDVGDDGTPVPMSPAEVDVGRDARPVGIAVVPDGSAVYVASKGSGEHGGRGVFAFAVGADGSLAPGATPAFSLTRSKLWFLSASPDGKSLFVAGGDGWLFDLFPGASLAPKASPSVDLRGAFGVVVSPNQAPVAGFSAIPGTAGAPTQFDASAAVDPDGSIVRYDWDFGDGTVLLDGGPTPSHVYTVPGSYTATLVVTDNEGASTTTIFTGGTVLGNGTPVAQATLQIQVLPAVAPPPPPPPLVVQIPPLRPDLGETLLAQPVAGQIRIRLPGDERFQRLSDIEKLPMGSTIDARRGRVELTTVRDRRDRLQEGRFFGGVFKVRQRERDRFVTELVLSERLRPCPPRGSASAARTSRRRLWGNGKGRFRSRGRYSSAAVRGTRWLVQDSCDGTLTIVRTGVVAVRDIVRDRRIVLRRGERYLASPR